MSGCTVQVKVASKPSFPLPTAAIPSPEPVPTPIGSAAVLSAKPPSPTEILNDADGDLVCFFRMLRERGSELARALTLTPYARAELRAANLHQPGLDELERARRVFVRLNMSISRTLGRQRGFAAAFNTNGADHAHKFASLVDHLQAAAGRLRRVILEDRPALEVIAKYGAPNAVIYCDPPYLHATRSAQAKRRGADYACEYALAAPADPIGEGVQP
jgi:DNA adenine methylase